MHPHPRTLLFSAAAMALAVTLSACGGGGTHAASGTTTTTTGGRAGSQGFPGTSGSVAAVSGSSMEVQNQQTGQVTVSWKSSTTFSQTATVAASSVTVGDCVTVIGSSASGALTATTVTVSQPDSSGSCSTNPFGGGSGLPGGGFPGGTPPNGGSLPSRPSGSLPAGGSGFGFASGKVSSVGATSLVLYGTSSSGFGGNPPQGSTPPTTAKPTSVTVTVTSSTHYSETESASASSLAVGDCVTANGSTDSTGQVTATNIRITSTGGQSCSNGFAPPGATPNG